MNTTINAFYRFTQIFPIILLAVLLAALVGLRSDRTPAGEVWKLVLPLSGLSFVHWVLFRSLGQLSRFLPDDQESKGLLERASRFVALSVLFTAAIAASALQFVLRAPK